ncbi:uncharacterized protein RJT20DRAFT_128281 [Scheffersomyces xylosifermentans]|uniref:uncharacterized protein n=1 Tax=Scheffersomyces xylosifermentans TaxID=1304137 RepID=UPI00315D96BB
MPEFDDVLSSSQYRPHLDYDAVSVIDRYTVLLKDGETTATIYPVHSPSELPPGLLAFLCDEFNMEIERGETSSFFDTLHIEQFQNYWFGAFAAVMVLGDSPALEGAKEWEKECLGTFYVKPNFPGRCSHICTANFLVNAGIRGKGIGRTLTDCYLQWAPRLGYTYSIFNLVFETNVAARSIWESLNFKRIGRVKSAGILKGHDQAVDAIMYGRELINTSDPAVGAYRFDKIKFYLETGRYPSMADRQEKSRLRSSASHYTLENGKLLLKGREVVSNPVRQLQICSEVHLANHGGINKTTSIVTEKYHWTRIKDTVATAIKNCAECRDPARDVTMLKRSNNSAQKKISGAASNRHRNNKIFHSQPNNPNARNILKSRPNDEVEAMVAAAQLHNLPGNRHDTDLLSHDLAGLDDNLIAVVEEAQRTQQQQHRQQQDRANHPQSHHTTHQSYASAAANGVPGDNNHYQQYSNEYHNNYQDSNSNNDKPRSPEIDPEVSGYNHNSGGDEIEIARALIQANEDEQEAGAQEGRSQHQHEDASSRSRTDQDEANVFINEDN